jgi:hypothetical protein
MRFAEQVSRSNKFPLFWAADNKFRLFFDVEGYLGQLAFLWEYYGTHPQIVWHIYILKISTLKCKVLRMKCRIPSRCSGSANSSYRLEQEQQTNLDISQKVASALDEQTGYEAALTELGDNFVELLFGGSSRTRMCRGAQCMRNTLHGHDSLNRVLEDVCPLLDFSASVRRSASLIEVVARTRDARDTNRHGQQ